MHENLPKPVYMSFNFGVVQFLNKIFIIHVCDERNVVFVQTLTKN